MNIVKRVFNLKKLFALVMTIVMMSTLSVPGFTSAMDNELFFSNPLVACYYIRTNNLTNVINGNTINMTGSNLRAKDDSFYAELIDRTGRKLDQLDLPNGHIIVDVNKFQFSLISCSVLLQNWLQSNNDVFDSYFEQGFGGLSLNVYVSMENPQGEIVGILKVAKIMLDTITDDTEDSDSDLMANQPIEGLQRIPQLRYNFDPAMNNEPEYGVDRNFSGNPARSRTRSDVPVDPNFDVNSFFAVNSDEFRLGEKRARH